MCPAQCCNVAVKKCILPRQKQLQEPPGYVVLGSRQRRHRYQHSLASVTAADSQVHCDSKTHILCTHNYPNGHATPEHISSLKHVHSNQQIVLQVCVTVLLSCFIAAFQGVTVGFIGVGNMGSPMAYNLLTAGHSVVVYDRNPEAVARLGDQGAAVASSPKHIAETKGG